jgi:hypothetical protein
MKAETPASTVENRAGAFRLGPFPMALVMLLLLISALASIILADRSRDITLVFLSEGLFLALLIVIAWNGRRRPLFVFAVILWWLILQNIILTPLSKLLHPSTVRLLIGAKEFLFLLILASSVLHFVGRLSKRGRENFAVLGPDIVAVFFLVILAVAFLRGHSFPFLTRATYLRFFAILPVCYFVGRSLPLDARHLKSVFRLTVGAALTLSLFGFFELLFLKDSFWKSVGVLEFFSAKGTAAWTAVSVKFYNWHTWDFGFPMRRMISLILEPTTLGEFFAGATLMTVFSGFFIGLKREVLAFVLLAGLILSFGKGGWVIFMVGAFMILLKEHKRLAVVVGALFLVFGALFVLYNIQAGGNVPIHIRGFYEGARFAAGHPLGAGLGSGGVFAALYGAQRHFQGKESTLGTMLVQMGFVGTLLYVLFFLLLIRNLSRLAGAPPDQPEGPLIQRSALVISGCLAGLFIVTFFSESAMGVIGTGLFLVIAGILHNFYPKKVTLSL